MLKIRVNNKSEHIVELDTKDNSRGMIDGKDFEWNIAKINATNWHILQENRSYNVQLLQHNSEEKFLLLKINGNKYSITAKDKYDELLQKLGMDASASKKVNNLKAPMPGLVLDIMVSEGAVVKKGDSILILEAMKMENILKAPADVTVKKINVKKGIAVEKNQVLIDFV